MIVRSVGLGAICLALAAEAIMIPSTVSLPPLNVDSVGHHDGKSPSKKEDTFDILPIPVDDWVEKLKDLQLGVSKPFPFPDQTEKPKAQKAAKHEDNESDDGSDDGSDSDSDDESDFEGEAEQQASQHLPSGIVKADFKFDSEAIEKWFESVPKPDTDSIKEMFSDFDFDIDDIVHSHPSSGPMVDEDEDEIQYVKVWVTDDTIDWPDNPPVQEDTPHIDWPDNPPIQEDTPPKKQSKAHNRIQASECGNGSSLSATLCRIRLSILEHLAKVKTFFAHHKPRPCSKHAQQKPHSLHPPKVSGGPAKFWPHFHPGEKMPPQYADRYSQGHHHTHKKIKTDDSTLMNILHAAHKGLRILIDGFLIPILIGIAAGMTASLVGMCIGTLLAWLWIKFVRGGKRGNASVRLTEEPVVVEDEKDGLLEGDVDATEIDAPPQYVEK